MGLWLGGDQKEKVLGGVSGIITQLPESPGGPVMWMWLTLPPFAGLPFASHFSEFTLFFFKNNIIIY